MLNHDLERLRGCIHKERPSTKTCHNCGQPLCYECYFDANVGQRVVARTSVDAQVQADYVFFCAACYLEWAEKKYGRLVEEPKILTAPFDIAFKYGGRFPNFIGLGFTLLLIPLIVGLFFWAINYADLKKEYDKQQRALAILKQRRAANPLCPRCGSRMRPGKNFCPACGARLSDFPT